MCNFASFFVNVDCVKKPLKLVVGDLCSHSGSCDLVIPKEQHTAFNKAYREVEWTDDDESTLTVRRLDDDPAENMLRACILAVYPTRQKFLDWAFTALPAGLTTLDLCRVRNIMLPAELPAGLAKLVLMYAQNIKLPAALSAGLTTLDLYGANNITLPAELPAGLKTLDMRYSKDIKLPAVLPKGCMVIR